MPTTPILTLEQTLHKAQKPEAQIAAKKVGVLFFNLGGPDSLEAVQPFLRNLFLDNDIIQLPKIPGVQRVFAELISRRRAQASQANYAEIGGASPLLDWSQKQAAAVQAKLLAQGISVTPYVAMRYWYPFCGEAIQQIRSDGIEHLILAPLYPHYSLATTGSSFHDYERVLQQTGFQPEQTSVLCSYYQDPRYLKALAATVEETLSQNKWSVPLEDVLVLFSAHGLPQRFVKKNQDPYPRQIKASAEAVMQQYFPKNRWQISYQSRVGPVRWLEPYTDQLLMKLAKAGQDNVLVVPISFVSEHVETLVELDIEYLPMGREAGMSHLYRAAALNLQPDFIDCLATLIQQAIGSPNLCKVQIPDFSHARPLTTGGSCGVQTP
jgi:protoporphyrin/coproporphyrin ferrochelatase